MHGVPGERVMFRILRVGLQRSGHDGDQTNEHCGGKDEDQQRQEHDEGERAEDEAERDGLPAELLQFKSDGRRAALAAFDKDVLLAQPDKQGAQGLTEGPKEGGLHASELPDAVEIAGDETRFGVVGTGGLLKRGRLPSLRYRDRVHGLDSCYHLIRTEHLHSGTNSPNPTLPGHAWSMPDTRRTDHN